MLPRLLVRLKTLLTDLIPEHTHPLYTTGQQTENPETLVDYREEYINFHSGDLRMCGTLTLPNIDVPCPAVVLIHGSGPHTRDQIIGPHQQFQLLADYLSRRGIAVLRYDKRGVAYSEGDYKNATSLDFANDAQAAFNFLKSRTEVSQAGLIGHSEGGLVASIVSSRVPNVAFVALLAAPAIPAMDLLLAKVALYSKVRGLNDNHVQHNVSLAKKTFAVVRSEPNNLVTARTITDLRRGHPYEEFTHPFMDSSIDALTNNWFRYFLSHEPRPVLSAIKCPLLALNGDKDMQVFADENLLSIKSCLRRNPNALTIKLSGLNHLLQTCHTGMPDEYEKLPEAIAPTALQIISSWITKMTSH